MTDSKGPSPSGEPKSSSPSLPLRRPSKPELVIEGPSDMTLREIAQGLLDARSKARGIETFAESLIPLVMEDSKVAEELDRVRIYARDLSERVYDIYAANAKKAL